MADQSLDKKVGKVTYYESPTFAIAGLLKEQGYLVADHMGHHVEEPLKDCVGILLPRVSVKQYFGGLYRRTNVKASFIGTLWVKSFSRRANSSNWVLEVYGRKNIPQLTELMDKAVESKNINVKLVLDKEQEIQQFYSSLPSRTKIYPSTH